MKGTRFTGVLDIPERTVGEWAIVHVQKPPGFTFPTATMRTVIFGHPLSKVEFPDATRWHELREDGSVWMTDYPIEQVQMNAMVEQASGHVIVGGLGLGYAAVALAKRRSVKTVTVVERAPEVIELTWASTVTASGRNHAKLRVENADLFDYLKATPERFDSGLYDIWTGDNEATFHNVVMPLRRLSEGKVKRITCWNEDIMRAQLFQGLSMRLLLMRTPTSGDKIVVSPTLDELCEMHDIIYTDWAIPFWRWVREKFGQDVNEHQEQILGVARMHSQLYGRGARTFDDLYQFVSAGGRSLVRG